MNRGARTLCRVLVLSAAFILSGPAPAHAEWQFSPFIGYTFRDHDQSVDFDLSEDSAATDEPHLNFGGRVRLIGDSPIGVEAYYVHTPGVLRRQAVQHQPAPESREPHLRGHGKRGARHAAPLESLRAEAVAVRRHRSDARSLDDQGQVLPFTLNLLGMNIGGGAVGFLSDRIGVRLDLRYFRYIGGVSAEDLDLPVTFGDSVRLRYWTLGFGVVIKK